MNTINFDIRQFTLDIKSDLAEKTKNLFAKGVNLKLCDICVGSDPSIESYVRIKSRIASELGVELIVDILDEDISQVELHKKMVARSTDPKIHGIILESPLPLHLDYNLAISQINPIKDVDGLHPKNLGRLINNTTDDGLIPATPLACMKILSELFPNLSGLNIVIIGSGRTVGKPLANILMNHDATVFVCNKYTKNLAEICRKSDVIITAAGVIKLITAEMITEKTVIIDVGQNYTSEGKMVGDADYEALKDIVSYITPVPGGVGPVTNAMIFENLLQCVFLQEKADPFEVSVNYFIEQSRGPNMPGGGGIAAMTAIQSASMVSMVYNLTKDIDCSKEISELSHIIDELKEIYSKDIEVFNAYLLALKLPKETDEQKALRSEKIQNLLKEACDIPLSLANNCKNILEIAKHAAKVGNSHALSDVEVGIELSQASAISALSAVDLNIRTIKDLEFSETMKYKKEDILVEITILKNNIVQILSER